MNILQHILLPAKSIYSNDAGLYVKLSDKVRLVDGVLHIPAYQKVDFDTYFNYFSVKKWVDFAQIDNLFIRGNINGVALIEIVGIKQVGKSRQQFLLYSAKVGKLNEWADFRGDIIGFQEYDALFVRICSFDEKCELGLLEFGTENIVKRTVRLAVCLLDDDNRQFVYEEINSIRRINGLDIEIVDTNAVEVCQNDMLLRSLDLVKNSDRTHILVLSGRQFVSGESIFRALRFFEMVFAERADVMVVGDNISALSDNKELQSDVLKLVLKGGSKRHSLCWPFCFFDKMIMEAFGLPLPLSLSQSAKEYKSRTYKEIVPLNGVAFYGDLATGLSLIEREYYEIRDGILVELFQSQPDFPTIKSLVWDRFWKNIHTYQYVGARLNLYALDHIVKGTYKSESKDIERFVHNLYHKENKFTKYCHIANREQKESEPIKKTVFNAIKPYVGFGKSTIALSRENADDFFGRNNVLITDEFGNAEIARIRRKKAAKLIAHSAKSYAEFIKKYHKIRMDVLQYRNDKKRY